jgi:hypothetical protein
LNPNANVWGYIKVQYAGLDSCTLAKNVNHFISVTRHVPRVLIIGGVMILA